MCIHSLPNSIPGKGVAGGKGVDGECQVLRGRDLCLLPAIFY